MSRDFVRIATAKVMTGYIDFVYRTSRVEVLGPEAILRDPDGEKMIALFWHEDSFCLYPALKGLNLYIVVTRDRRGDYIADVCSHYGYRALRVPDASEGGNHLFQIRKAITGEVPANIAITLDGPIGIYHVPKDFALVAAMLTRRRVMPITAEVKRCFRLTGRWDRFKIPLPFNHIKIHFNQPMVVCKDKGEDPFASIKNEIVAAMEEKSNQHEVFAKKPERMKVQ